MLCCQDIGRSIFKFLTGYKVSIEGQIANWAQLYTGSLLYVDVVIGSVPASWSTRCVASSLGGGYATQCQGREATEVSYLIYKLE